MSEASYSQLFLVDPALAIALRRRATAEDLLKAGTSTAPIRSPWEGVNRVAQALIAGWDIRKADEAIKDRIDADKEETASFQRSVADALMGKGQAPSAPTGTPSAPAPAAPTSTPPSPSTQAGSLDPRDAGIRTMLAEAGGEGPAGMAAVAHVINNRLRTGKWGNDTTSVVTAPMQFSPWNPGSGNDPRRFDPASPEYQAAAKIYDDVVSGKIPDPTGGALHFANPRTATAPWVGQAMAGDPANRTAIGNHVFFRGLDVGMPQQGAPQAPPQQTAAVAQPQTAAAANAAGVPGIPTRPPDQNQALMAIYLRGLQSTNPRVRALAQGIAPFVAKEAPAATVQEVPLSGGLMQKVISYDQGKTWQPMGTAYDPRGPDRDLVPIRRPDGSTVMVPRPDAAGLVNAPEIPSGFRPGPDGRIEPIPGGPADPNRQQPPPSGYTQQGERLAPIPGGPADPNRPQPPPSGYRPAGVSDVRLEAIPGGPEDPARKGFDRANTLRDEYTKLTNDFRIIQDAHQKLVEAAKANTGAGDMALLYSIVKLLDPNSVVRESEFATAASSGSFGERIQGLVARILRGERMAPSLRQEFVDQADAIYKSQRRTYENVREQFSRLAKSFGLDPDQVIVNYVNPPPEVAPPIIVPGEPAKPGNENPLGIPLSGRR